MSKEITESKAFLNWTIIISDKIKQAQTRASFKVNEEMLQLYWDIGNSIITQQKQEGWGTKIIDLLAYNLAVTFPNSTGFSLRNLKYMRAFAEA